MVWKKDEMTALKKVEWKVAQKDYETVGTSASMLAMMTVVWTAGMMVE